MAIKVKIKYYRKKNRAWRISLQQSLRVQSNQVMPMDNIQRSKGRQRPTQGTQKTQIESTKQNAEVQVIRFS